MKDQQYILMIQFPFFWTRYPSPDEIHGIIKNGIDKIGFNTIGVPKIIGSLIPQIPGINENFAIDLWSSRFEKMKIAINNDRVIPPPPTTTKLVQKPLVKNICCNSSSLYSRNVFCKSSSR